MSTSGFGRLVAEGANPIDTARVLAFGILCALIKAFFGARRWWAMIGWFATSLVLLLFLAQTASRGPWIGLMASIVVLAVVSNGARVVVVVASVGFFFIRAAANTGNMTLFFNVPVLARALALEGDGADLTSGRAEAAGTAVRALSQFPLGVGWGNFGEVPGSGLGYVHNIVLEIGVEAGWIGLAGFIILVTYLFRCLVNFSTDDSSWLFFALFTFWLTVAFFSSDFGGNRGLWLLLGVSMGYCGVLRSGVHAHARSLVSRLK
ncbi:O-antigen ligase family protein [Dietzia maris]|uniref:O-antigen ligase family protein n=1 Tax=Dietzia maris TaxID=37915 RepID=A0ABT8H4U0_9ACTN|nr:O-antigen ligase family protein [Dietzia maris]MDN4507487.1 O-antigen ligase family protein [Dietzia maris]